MIIVGAIVFGLLALLVGAASVSWKLCSRMEADRRVDAIEEAFERGKRVGADELGSALAEIACERGDEIDDEWPALPTRRVRPS